MTETQDTFEGGCRCGKVRYKSNAPPMVSLHCHCRDCQYASGGAFSTIVIVASKEVELNGELNGYTVTADSGNQLTRKFCPTCGTPILTQLLSNDDILVLKAGTMDDPSWLTPVSHTWTASGLPWSATLDELPRYEKSAS